MQFLRTLFWVVLAVVAVIFAFNNWQVVSVRLWGDLILDSPLPVLLALAFLAGFIPGLILHRTTRWRLGRRLDAAHRNFGESAAPSPALPRSEALTADVAAPTL